MLGADYMEEVKDFSLYCFYTPNFEPLLIRFLSGIQDNIDLYCHELDMNEVVGNRGGMSLWLKRISTMIESANKTFENHNQIIVFADIDIAVYRPMASSFKEALENYDVVFQLESNGEIKKANLGVVAFYPSDIVVRFWQDVYKQIADTGQSDQDAVNALISDKYYLQNLGLKIGFLTEQFWISKLKKFPENDCILHHATQLTSSTKKWLQLNGYKTVFNDHLYETDAAFCTVKRLLREREWRFGELSQKLPYGHMRFNKALLVQNYGHPNEHRLIERDQHLIMMTLEDKISCIFDEFYTDIQRKKVMAIGNAFIEDGKKFLFHYLIADL